MVVRFAPYKADTLLKRAERDYQRLIDEGRTPLYSVSVFAIERPDEQTTIEQLIMVICQTAPVGGRKCAVTTERHLEAEGFRVERSEPPLHHHDVHLGHELREMDVKRLAAVFELGARRNPAWHT